MELIINGKTIQCGEGLSVTALLGEQEVKMPDMVSVELNGEILRREKFDQTTLKQGDKVEFLYFMGGGGGTN
jgi:sulfur carrier protein